jgi:hypothetical protein
MFKAALSPARIIQFCAVVLALIYLASGFGYLCLDYWSVTQQDFWRIYDICLNHSWLHSALYKFNEHSLFFPSFIWIADLRFFHGDQTIIFYASVLLLFASTALLLLPVWRDKELDLTTKLLAVLVIVAVSFWMGRASITVASGFNCMASFVMLGVASAIVLLPNCESSAHWWLTALGITFAGYISSFSFATGLAIWPCLLYLGWCLRLRWRCLAVLLGAGVCAVLIFHFLPPRGDHSGLLPSNTPLLAITLEAFVDFSRLMGAPILYCIASWKGVQVTPQLTHSSSILLGTGALAVVLGILTPAAYLFRRNLHGRTLELTGLALITFNFVSLLLVVCGRLVYFRQYPGQIAAPRYIFWSALFWAGFLLVALGLARQHRKLKWPVAVLILLAPILAWPCHCEEARHWRYSKLLTEQGATALLNGVYDPDQILFRELGPLRRLAPQLRARRLDMFAAGYQDWIGKPSQALFKSPPLPDHFRATAKIAALPNTADQTNVAKITGRLHGTRSPPSVMVILDPRGKVVGLARSFVTDRWIDAIFFDNRMPHAPFVGYIRGYDPALQYTLRSISRGHLSSHEIPIPGAPQP